MRGFIEGQNKKGPSACRDKVGEYCRRLPNHLGNRYGETATVEQACEVCALIRRKLEALYDINTADKISIYGGSVKSGMSENYSIARY